MNQNFMHHFFTILYLIFCLFLFQNSVLSIHDINVDVSKFCKFAFCMTANLLYARSFFRKKYASSYDMRKKIRDSIQSLLFACCTSMPLYHITVVTYEQICKLTISSVLCFKISLSTGRNK